MAKSNQTSKPKAGRQLRPASAATNGTALQPKPKNELRNKLKPKQTPEAANAEFMIEGLAMNAFVGWVFSSKLGALDMTECLAQMILTADATTGGNRKNQEAMLSSQVISLNAIYTDCAILAHGNLDKGLDVFERLMRIGLKAQSQSRATAESLAVMQNPPTVFAKQANIANGPQQVNNGVSSSAPVARAENSETRPIKLLEAHGERVDGGTAGKTGARDRDLAPVGARHRPANRRG